MDSSSLARLTASLMEELDRDFVDGAKVGTVAIIAAVEHGEGEERESTIVLTSTDERAWVQRALLSEGFMALEVEQEEA